MNFTNQMIQATMPKAAPVLPNGLPAPPQFAMPAATAFAAPANRASDDFQTLTQSKIGQFILIVGPPFSGKTTACMTFPNPRFINLDNKLPAGAVCVPFHEPAFCDKWAPRSGNTPPNKRDAVQQWLYNRIGSIDPDITLILDSFSSLSDAFHLQSELVEDIGTSKAGNRALLKVFGAKLAYLETIFTLLKMMPCRVVVTAHTMPEYDEQGRPTGAVKPFCTGSFSDKIASYATDVLRSFIQRDPQSNKILSDPKTGEITGYRWGLRPDTVCPMTNSLIKLPPGVTSIRARWQDLKDLIDQQDSVAAPASVPTTEQPKQ